MTLQWQKRSDGSGWFADVRIDENNEGRFTAKRTVKGSRYFQAIFKGRFQLDNRKAATAELQFNRLPSLDVAKATCEKWFNERKTA